MADYGEDIMNTFVELEEINPWTDVEPRITIDLAKVTAISPETEAVWESVKKSTPWWNFWAKFEYEERYVSRKEVGTTIRLDGLTFTVTEPYDRMKQRLDAVGRV